jgi:hypothetical protein
MDHIESTGPLLLRVFCGCYLGTAAIYRATAEQQERVYQAVAQKRPWDIRPSHGC